MCCTFSSSGPRLEQTSVIDMLVDDSEVQCAFEGVYAAEGGSSETMVQRQCVRVGAAVVDAEKTSVERMSEIVDVTSILAKVTPVVKLKFEGTRPFYVARRDSFSTEVI